MFGNGKGFVKSDDICELKFSHGVVVGPARAVSWAPFIDVTFALAPVSSIDFVVPG